MNGIYTYAPVSHRLVQNPAWDKGTAVDQHAGVDKRTWFVNVQQRYAGVVLLTQ